MCLLTASQNNLEYELRLQQYVEMVRSGDTKKLMDATLHARKYLAAHQDKSFAIRAAGLLAFPPETPHEPYKVRTSHKRQITRPPNANVPS